MWFIGVEVEQETSAPPPEKNPGSAPDLPTEHFYAKTSEAVPLQQPKLRELATRNKSTERMSIVIVLIVCLSSIICMQSASGY